MQHLREKIHFPCF